MHNKIIFSCLFLEYGMVFAFNILIIKAKQESVIKVPISTAKGKTKFPMCNAARIAKFFKGGW
jgi:hypothetical protein